MQIDQMYKVSGLLVSCKKHYNNQKRAKKPNKQW